MFLYLQISKTNGKLNIAIARDGKFLYRENQLNGI